MVGDRSTTQDLLDRADTEFAAGRGDAARLLYREAAERCRAADDLAGWTRAALGSASTQDFESEPGLLPAELFEVYERIDAPASRARLAAALARCWVYAGEAARAVPFADEAMALADGAGDPLLKADSLDAALTASWGPRDLDRRRQLAARLDNVTGHLSDPDAQLRRRLWLFQIACEELDVPAMNRQLRALERLGENAPRARFFAASRRLMVDLLRGRTDTAGHLVEIAREAADHALIPDAWKVLEAMRGFAAIQAGDTQTCASVAAHAEEYALAEGVASATVEAATLWLGAEQPDRAHTLLGTLETVLDKLPPDVNWLLVQQLALHVAVAVDHLPVIERSARLLAPFEGRCVMNAGAVLFHGVTDDPLARAHARIGDHPTAERLRRRALSTYDRIGASWWRDRLFGSMPATPSSPADARRHLHPAGAGLWVVGPDGASRTIVGVRGLDYLHALLRRPGEDVAVLDLVASSQGHASVQQAGLGDVIDEQARRAYRLRLDDLEAEIDEAAAWNDIARRESATRERDALVAELARATGLGGASRVAGATSERARTAVRKAIVTAIRRIEEVDASMAHHLHRHIVTGTFCRYEPDMDHIIEWILA